MNKERPFHDDLGVVCLGEELTSSQEIVNFCYILNRCVLQYYDIELPQQRPETLVFQRRFDEKYCNRVFGFIKTRGHNILTMLEIAAEIPTFTENTFDKLVENELKNFESVNYECSCLFAYLCFRVAMVGVHFVKCGDIADAKDWAYAHMLRAGATYILGGTIAERELMAEAEEERILNN